MAEYDYWHYDAVVPRTLTVEEAALVARIVDLERRVEALEDIVWRREEE